MILCVGSLPKRKWLTHDFKVALSFDSSFLGVFPIFRGCSGFFGCSGMFRDVPVFRVTVFVEVLHARMCLRFIILFRSSYLPGTLKLLSSPESVAPTPNGGH